MKPKRQKAEAVHGGRIVPSTGRKDRHSKVCTASGTKDRRVRLSPKTAIQFYDVQDRLGCDRPSKAIDWLIKEAKLAIDALDGFSGASGQQIQQGSDSGMIQKLDNSNAADNPISSFGDLTNGVAPPLSSIEFKADINNDELINSSTRRRNEAHGQDLLLYPNYEHGFSSASVTSQKFDEDFEFCKLETWNYAIANSGDNQMISQREPLQSSFINHVEFPCIDFYSAEEFSDFTAAAATLKEQSEKDKVPISSEPSFLQKQG